MFSRRANVRRVHPLPFGYRPLCTAAAAEFRVFDLNCWQSSELRFLAPLAEVQLTYLWVGLSQISNENFLNHRFFRVTAEVQVQNCDVDFWSGSGKPTGLESFQLKPAHVEVQILQHEFCSGIKKWMFFSWWLIWGDVVPLWESPTSRVFGWKLSKSMVFRPQIKGLVKSCIFATVWYRFLYSNTQSCKEYHLGGGYFLVIAFLKYVWYCAKGGYQHVIIQWSLCKFYMVLFSHD